MPKTLPKFNKPPVVEVVCGIQFKEVESLKVPHIGFLWEKFGKLKFPMVAEAPLTLLNTEPGFKIIEKPELPRIWFENKSSDKLIQIQRNGFWFNWRKKESDSPYPSYDKVIKNFFHNLEIFSSFVTELGDESLVATHHELSYINVIPVSQCKTVNNLGKIFKIYPTLVPHLSNVNSNFIINLDNGIMLRVHISNAISRLDQDEVFRFELSAQAEIRPKNISQSKAWFNQAHEGIVSTFTDLTTPTMHKVWERYDK